LINFSEFEDPMKHGKLEFGEVTQLVGELRNTQDGSFEIKYKKALKEISGIIKANKQLKE
jgi:hypothetical protein